MITNDKKNATAIKNKTLYMPPILLQVIREGAPLLNLPEMENLKGEPPIPKKSKATKGLRTFSKEGLGGYIQNSESPG